MTENRKQLFVGGDLSGIQSFLYNISSKRAAVSLKGRSAYLSDYMDKACDKLIAATKQVDINKVYCSGGKFYFITDDTPDICKAIDECAAELKRDIWNEHYGQLGLNIGYVSFTENEDGTVNTANAQNEKPGVLWKIVNEDFARQKNQKFKEFLLTDFDSFFNPIEVGDKPKICAVTGIESEKCINYTYRSPGGDDTTMLVLPSVKEQIERGERLSRDEGTKSFEDYADGTYLGILRMDVDGLGKRFITGFNSISDYKKFSSRLVEFFENEVKEIRKEPEFKPYINIIYAGGDDLFIVGRWDKTIDIAHRIHSEVEKRFSSDAISISGGVAIVKPKFPIAKAAEMAGDAEDAAKRFNDGEKNAFNFFGTTVSWTKEFDYVRKQKDQFVDLIDRHGLSKSILHKLMLYASIASKNEERKLEGKPQDFSYLWHASYYLTRQIKSNDKDNECVTFLRTLRDKDLTLNGGRNLQLIAVAARWAELQLRKTE